MIWAQSIASFVVWITFGMVLARSSSQIRERSMRGSRTARALLAAGMLFGSAMLLLGGLYAINEAGGLSPNGMLWWAWALVTGLGLVFVLMQTMASALVVLLAQEAVTQQRAAASTSQESEEGEK